MRGEQAVMEESRGNDGGRDIERAVAELCERLPAPLAPLARLTYNYRWSWMDDGATVFRDLYPGAWRRSRCNPLYVLEAVPTRRLKEMAADGEYVARIEAMAARLEADLRRPALGAVPVGEPVAYFCSEFGVHCSLPLYGGGLGVLAGDLVKAASDLALPLVGVGLLYREGYFHQRFDISGWQYEYWVETDFERLPAVLVTGGDQLPLTVEVVIRDRVVKIQVWRIEVGRVQLYLLDTDREDNNPIDRFITSRLYVGDRHTRLAQYAVLGIGGMRALTQMGIRPSLLHLNEGHAALSSLERLRVMMNAGKSFEEALAAVRRQTVFTTHTPVPAGNEGYSREEIEPVLGNFLDSLKIPRLTFYNLGRLAPGNEQEPASITPLALRTSRASNGVSRRHGEVARAMWQPLWRHTPVEQVPISHVTNGVHVNTWMAPPMQRLLDCHLGESWRDRVTQSDIWKRIDQIPDEELWQVRGEMRERLVSYIRERSIRDRIGRGEAPQYVEAAARVFEANVLTIGFARRAATYKRLYLLTRHPERGLPLLSDGPRPVQVIVAGKAHPQDNEAKETLRSIFSLRANTDVSRRAAFAEDYDLHMAPRIVSGVDLWLNLPRPPLEASGTSGMKVSLNGGLNLSVLDGWWAEAYDGSNGWAIASPEADPATQDDHDAHALFDLLEKEVIPLFYERDEAGLPRRWLRRVKASMRTLIPQFTARRMLQDYVDTMYTPSSSSPPPDL